MAVVRGLCESIAIMTQYQAQLFQEFSYKIVCMDSTHKTNEYRFKLITLLVVDEFHKGIKQLLCSNTISCPIFPSGQPIAWAISDKEDEVVMEVILRAIKTWCPAGIITTLMTDDCKISMFSV